MDGDRLDPEMATYLRERDALRVQFAPPAGAKLTDDETRELRERQHRLEHRELPALAEISDRTIAVRGRRIYCRLYRPVDEPGLPVVVFLHGSGFYFCSVDTHDDIARGIALEGRTAVVSVDYALSPEVRFPHALQECAAVVRALAGVAAAWNVDASRIVVAGDSAGGALALATALLLRDTGGPALRGVYAAYPVCDADATTESYREFGNTLSLSADQMAFFWRTYVRDAIDLLHPLAAPLRADFTGFPPALVIAAELDVLRSEALALAAKMRAAGVEVEQHLVPGVTHGFLHAAHRVTAARTATETAGRWLRRVLA